ncbi:MAG: hypothetical protein V1744_08325 [Candidatus Altiarchaeota archaeon]
MVGLSRKLKAKTLPKKKPAADVSGKRQKVYSIIHKLHMLKVTSLTSEAESERITGEELGEILDELKLKGLIYSPKPGFVDCVD